MPAKVPLADRSRTAADTAVAAATALALVGWNNVVAALPWHQRRYVPANLLATAALLAVARLRGLRSSDLGLSADNACAGARRGATVGAAVLAAWAAAAVSPRHRRLLSDARVAPMTGRAVAHHAAVRVPLGTVVWEETAFRAVLPALLRRVVPERTARVATGLLFGLWHARPTLDALRLNGIRTDGARGPAAVVAAALAGAAADMALAHQQRVTGSLLAPALLHVAANSGGTLAAAIAGRSRRGVIDERAAAGSASALANRRRGKW